MNADDLVAMLLANLRETCEGPEDPSSAWFNSDRGQGLLGVLRKVDAATASREPSEGGKTIASHAAHAAFHLRASAAWLSGDRSAAEWPATWDPAAVNRADWIAVQQLLRQQYHDTAEAIRHVKSWTREDLGGAIGAIAHAAYHLAAIRQIIRHLKA